jgi:hypothetical protein
MGLDKFIPPYIDFINENFNSDEHLFFILHKPYTSFNINEKWKNVIWGDNKLKYFELLNYMYKSDKIIIHGLWSKRFVQLLFLQPWLLKKSYWVMWGGDFYFPEKQNWIKKQVIKNMGHLVTYIKGDYEYVKKHYRAKGIYHECLMYLSNVFDEKQYSEAYKIDKKNELWILVGNSATDTNRHEYIFDKLKSFKDKDIKLFVPLSYGDNKYREKILKIGKEIFKEKFYPIVDFLSYNDYLKLLYNIDIAIFAHNRQQAMGNTIQLLGLGKKVYLNRNTTQWQLFEDLGVKVFNVDEEFDLTFNKEELKHNTKIIKNFFSKERLKNDWNKILYEI